MTNSTPQTRNGKTFTDGDTVICTRKHHRCFGMKATLVENGWGNQGTMMVACDDKIPSKKKPLVIDWATYDGGSAMIISNMDWEVVA